MISFKVNWKIHVLSLIISFICMGPIYSIIDTILIKFLSEYAIGYVTTEELILKMCQYVIIFLIPMTIVHELLHASAYILFGGKVKFAFKGISAYTKEVSGIAIGRTEFLVVLMAPLVIITIISLFIPGSIGQIIFLLNLLGSSGDICMSLFLCRCRYNSKIIDRDYGFDVI